MNTTIKTDGCTAGDEGTLKDDFHLLFDDTFWEEMDHLPEIGNNRFYRISGIGIGEGNHDYKRSPIKPSDKLYCLDSEGNEILIPYIELKLYATQYREFNFGYTFTVFFRHINTGTIYYLEDFENEHYESDDCLINLDYIREEMLYALPLDGSAYKVIDEDLICYHNVRWFKLQSLNADTDW